MIVVVLLRNSISENSYGEDSQSIGGEKYSFGVALIVPAKERRGVTGQWQSFVCKSKGTVKICVVQQRRSKARSGNVMARKCMVFLGMGIA